MANIEIDDEAEIARRLGGHQTATEAVAAALRMYNGRSARATAYDRYFELAQNWDIEEAEVAHAAEKKQQQE